MQAFRKALLLCPRISISTIIYRYILYNSSILHNQIIQCGLVARICRSQQLKWFDWAPTRPGFDSRRWKFFLFPCSSSFWLRAWIRRVILLFDAVCCLWCCSFRCRLAKARRGMHSFRTYNRLEAGPLLATLGGPASSLLYQGRGSIPRIGIFFLFSVGVGWRWWWRTVTGMARLDFLPTKDECTPYNNTAL